MQLNKAAFISFRDGYKIVHGSFCSIIIFYINLHFIVLYVIAVSIYFSVFYIEPETISNSSG